MAKKRGDNQGIPYQLRLQPLWVGPGATVVESYEHHVRKFLPIPYFPPCGKRQFTPFSPARRYNTRVYRLYFSDLYDTNLSPSIRTPDTVRCVKLIMYFGGIIAFHMYPVNRTDSVTCPYKFPFTPFYSAHSFNQHPVLGLKCVNISPKLSRRAGLGAIRMELANCPDKKEQRLLTQYQMAPFWRIRVFPPSAVFYHNVLLRIASAIFGVIE